MQQALHHLSDAGAARVLLSCRSHTVNISSKLSVILHYVVADSLYSGGASTLFICICQPRHQRSLVQVQPCIYMHIEQKLTARHASIAVT